LCKICQILKRRKDIKYLNYNNNKDIEKLLFGVNKSDGFSICKKCFNIISYYESNKKLVFFIYLKIFL
jgi:hypothetical protein